MLIYPYRTEQNIVRQWSESEGWSRSGHTLSGLVTVNLMKTVLASLCETVGSVLLKYILVTPDKSTL